MRRMRKASVDTLDIEDYLSPTFDRMDVLNPHGDLTPPSEAPPPIPTVSYARTPNGGRRKLAPTPTPDGDAAGAAAAAAAASPNIKDATWS